MIRTVGAFLILLSSAWLGLSAEKSLLLRIRALESILPALSLLKAEIEGLRTPIPDALFLLSRQSSLPASLLFSETLEALRKKEPFSGAFSSALFKSGGTWGLSDEDIEALSELCPVLGRYSAGEQASALDRVIIRLEASREAARSQQSRRGRLYRTMGFLFGAILILVVI